VRQKTIGAKCLTTYRNRRIFAGNVQDATGKTVELVRRDKQQADKNLLTSCLMVVKNNSIPPHSLRWLR